VLRVTELLRPDSWPQRGRAGVSGRAGVRALEKKLCGNYYYKLKNKKSCIYLF